MTKEQLTFDLGQRPALGREDFLVAAGNETAVAWIDRWPDWPGPVLALYAPPGSGKSHLAQVWCGLSEATELVPATLETSGLPERLGDCGAVLLEDGDRAIAGYPGREEALLHLHNSTQYRLRSVVWTGRSAPARWPVGLRDLASRLAAAAAVELASPDEELLRGLLLKQFYDRQLQVSKEVIEFLLRRMERSAATARDLVAAIDGRALEARREISLPLAREVLAARQGTASEEADH